jgi:hypothetical protein
MRVCGEIACRPKPFEFGAKPPKMAVRGLRDMDVRQCQPVLDGLHDVLNAKRASHHSPVRGDPHEPQDRRPRQPDAFRARQA